jgi:zinc protease
MIFGAVSALADDPRPRPLAPNQWAQSQSDVKPDPAVRFGQLPNGMTYALMHNQTPMGQASFRLRIAAGSMMESDAQQGLAHFLEHMAFNGSTHVPTGEMVKILERHGLAFGADTNASTSWGETIYQLDLPKTDTDTVDTSLMLLREIAGELKLPQDAMERERGVVLSEERLDDNPNYRTFKSRLQFLLPGQKASERLPIGQVQVIRTAPRAELEDFYDKYYRPERATLVVVGDFDVDAMEAKIKARFGGWTNAHPAGADADLGALHARKSEAQLIVEPGAPLSIQVGWNKPADNAPETLARDRADALQDLAISVLNRRLERITRGANPPFIGASADQEDLFDSARSTTLHISAKPDDWKTALAAAVREQRRLVDYGVLKSELDREIQDARTTLVEHVASAQTRGTRELANMIVGALAQRSVVQSPAQELAQFDDTVKTITAEEVSQAAKTAFSGSGPLIFMSTPQAIDGGAQVLKAAYQADQAEPVSAPTLVADKTWPYARFGAPGQVVERRDIPELGVVMARFANGVRLTVKPTDFRRSEVEVEVRFGHGRLDLSKATPSAFWAGSSFVEGGLKKLTAEDIDQTLNSKVVGANFSLDDNAFVLSGGAKSSDLDTQMQLLTAYIQEPAFRPEAFERLRAYGVTLDRQMDATPSGVMHRDLAALLHNGDARWATPDSATIAASKIGDLQSVLTRHLAQGPIEVVIVGDVTVDKAIAATAATLGALHRDPASSDTPPVDSRAVRFPTPSADPIIERHKGRADQAEAAVAWPTNDFYADMREARVLTVLGQIVQSRMIDDLRVQKGDTYSPHAGLTASQIFPGFGYLLAQVETPPDRIDTFFSELNKIAQDLRAAPVSQDELTRAVLPLVDQLKQARQTNEYWVAALTDAQTDPRKLESIRTQIAHYQGVSAADVQQAARKYMSPDRAWKLEVLPAPKVARAEGAGEQAALAN